VAWWNQIGGRTVRTLEVAMRASIRSGGLVVGVVAVLALLALVVDASLGDAEVDGQTDGPVISIGEDWDAYPTAEVIGRIALVDDCLLVGTSVVFWPHGTTWEQDRDAVVFGGDFEGSASASVGEEFSGGGGFYSAANVRGLKSLDAEAVVRCMHETGANDAVFAYPGD
jgi:hypothetical protein